MLWKRGERESQTKIQRQQTAKIHRQDEPGETIRTQRNDDRRMTEKIILL